MNKQYYCVHLLCAESFLTGLGMSLAYFSWSIQHLLIRKVLQSDNIQILKVSIVLQTPRDESLKIINKCKNSVSLRNMRLFLDLQ